MGRISCLFINCQITKPSGLEQNRDVSGYKMHESYSTNTNENDIALIYVINYLHFCIFRPFL